MTKLEKRKNIDKASYDINIAKDRLAKAVDTLQSFGSEKDAEQLFNMILKIEAFQNKYN